MQKRKRNKIVLTADAVIVNKYKKIVQGRETWQFREPKETRTDPDGNEIQTQWRSDLKNPIQLIQLDLNTQSNLNIDLIYISPQHNTSHKPSSPHPQQHSASPSLEETLAILTTISPGNPQGCKEKEPEPKQPKLQQYVGLMNIIERFHETMNTTIEEEKNKPKVILPGLYKEQTNKDGPVFFYPPKNYRPTPIPRPKDLNLLEQQWNQFEEDVSEGIVSFLSLTNRQPRSLGESTKGILHPRITKNQC
ncbi:MAG: hypothetical protein EZS28_009233 [Streblomastix strix]|uniref:Uncharacterized protein n=1 Tax=Streblomastix strix TaxID=222440 RepID=A0A5J4WL15_9EUKA|nr:MAG: hypothetical protein EZS28_009233 [Streblomastix strix]